MHHPRKFVSPLSAQAVAELEQRMKQDASARVRMRAHSILLSNRKMAIDVIAAFYDVSRDTVSRWIDRWEKDGIKGLQDHPRSGAPRIIGESERELVRRLVRRYPHSSRTVKNKFEALTGKTLSETTLRRILK